MCLLQDALLFCSFSYLFRYVLGMFLFIYFKITVTSFMSVCVCVLDKDGAINVNVTEACGEDRGQLWEFSPNNRVLGIELMSTDLAASIFFCCAVSQAHITIFLMWTLNTFILSFVGSINTYSTTPVRNYFYYHVTLNICLTSKTNFLTPA